MEFTVISSEKQTPGSHCAALPKYNRLANLVIQESVLCAEL
jgi:hypothetical protein